MKKIISILLLFYLVGESNGFDCKAQDVKNVVFTLDLNVPTSKTLGADPSRKSLYAKYNESISFYLKNANPFKYKYSIAGTPINLFKDGTNPFDSLNTLLANKSKVQPLSGSQTPSPSPDSSAAMSYNSLQLLSASSTVLTARVQLNISGPPATVDTSKSARMKIVINNMLLASQESTNLMNQLQSYQAQLKAEDYLDKNNFIMKRDNFNSRLIKLITYGDSVETQKTLIDSTSSQFDSEQSKFSTNVTAMQAIVSNFLSAQFDYFSLPFDVNWRNIDYLQVTLTRERQDAQTTQTSDAYNYNIWARGGLKVDISGGLFVTSLRDRNYFTTDSLNSGKKFISTKNEGGFAFGFGSMIDVNYRTGAQWIRPNFSVGLLFNSDQNFQFLSGFGFQLGKEQRIVLHIGTAMGVVQRLENGYTADTNNSVAYNLGTDGQIPTANKFSIGYFFGLTYNFSGTSSKTAGTDGK